MHITAHSRARNPQHSNTQYSRADSTAELETHRIAAHSTAEHAAADSRIRNPQHSSRQYSRAGNQQHSSRQHNTADSRARNPLHISTARRTIYFYSATFFSGDREHKVSTRNSCSSEHTQQKELTYQTYDVQCVWIVDLSLHLSSRVGSGGRTSKRA